MDWFPLYNSLRIAGISTVAVFFLGIFSAYYIARTPRVIKGILDVILTLPLVLPPTVVGYLLLRFLGPKRVLGAWVLEEFGVKMVMTWWSAIFATVVVSFPLMYRTARGAFESFDETLVEKRSIFVIKGGPHIGPFGTLYFLAGAHARLPPRHSRRHGALLCPGTGRIWSHQHDCGLYPGPHGHHLHHGLPALAHG